MSIKYLLIGNPEDCEEIGHYPDRGASKTTAKEADKIFKKLSQSGIQTKDLRNKVDNRGKGYYYFTINSKNIFFLIFGDNYLKERDAFALMDDLQNGNIPSMIDSKSGKLNFEGKEKLKEMVENFEKNKEEQRCYPILYLNETTFNDTYEYINVSVPTPYDVYINHNVCIFIDEEEEEKIINEYEDEIFKNIEEELNENKIEIEQNEIIKENEKDIKTEKELEIQKEETEKEYIKEYEKLKESKYEMEKEKEVELVNQNVEEKQKEMLEEYNEIEAESSIKIIEKELENKKEKFEIIEEEMIPEAVIEKEREIIKENIEENIKNVSKNTNPNNNPLTFLIKIPKANNSNIKRRNKYQ